MLQDLIAPFACIFANGRCLIKNDLPCRIIGNFVNDKNVGNGDWICGEAIVIRFILSTIGILSRNGLPFLSHLLLVIHSRKRMKFERLLTKRLAMTAKHCCQTSRKAGEAAAHVQSCCSRGGSERPLQLSLCNSFTPRPPMWIFSPISFRS